MDPGRSFVPEKRIHTRGRGLMPGNDAAQFGIGSGTEREDFVNRVLTDFAESTHATELVLDLDSGVSAGCGREPGGDSSEREEQEKETDFPGNAHGSKLKGKRLDAKNPTRPRRQLVLLCYVV